MWTGPKERSRDGSDHPRGDSSADAVRVEVIDHGSASSTPVVKGGVLASDGHGLFLVGQLAGSWGYVLDQVGTTVWFRLTG